jgi:aminoacyl tRNA synthase complex-interacting multifunctional protein 1
MRWFNNVQKELNKALSEAAIQEITLDLDALNLNPKKKEKKAKEPAAAAAPLVISPGLADLRVGKITSVKVHPDAESLYVETINFGEAEERIVVSGLVKHYTLEQMQDKLLIGVCNLKPAALRGIKSFGMVLCSTSAEGKVEFVDPPAGAKPGDRVFFEGFEDVVAEAQLNPKKKIWEQIQPGLKTIADKTATYTDPETGKVHLMRTAEGVCSCPNNIDAPIK